MRFDLKLPLFVFVLLTSLISTAQKPLNPPKDRGAKSSIEILYADSLSGIEGNVTFRRFVGNVAFKHNGVVLKCDLALQNMTTNTLESFGRIKIIQGDTLTITGDTLYYDGNNRFARILGRKVVLKDKKVTLTTKQINYNIPISSAYYPVKGYIVQDSSTLVSNQGTYNTRTKIFNYIGDVEIKSPTILLCTDTLDYNSNTYDAFFQSKTTITSADGIASADKGKYNTKSKVSKFQGRSSIASATYILEADTLTYDEKSQLGIGKGHVRFESFKDSVTIFSDKGIRKGAIGETYMDGQALLIRKTNADSLFINAKHFITYEKVDSTKKTDEQEFKLLIAYDSVRVWRHDFQSVSDSLRYDLLDSTIHFLKNPILWGKNNQMKADTIVSFLENNKLRKIHLITNGFVIAPDTLLNYNQVSARQINAYISKEDGSLEKVLANGNGETLYYAIDENNKMIGLNRVESSEMQIDFKRNEVQIIRFSGNPDAKLSPPKLIDQQEARLEKFELFENLRPFKPLFLPVNVK